MRISRLSPSLIFAFLIGACFSDNSLEDPHACVCSMPGVDGSDSGAPDSGAPDAGGTDAAQDGGVVALDPCGTSVVTADAGPVPVYCALHRTLVIDGDLKDWAGVPFTVLNRRTAAAVFGSGEWTPDAATDDADLSGTFALQWDAKYLYIAGALIDDVRAVHPSSSGYPNDDCFQIYLDGDHNRSPVYDADDLQVLVRADNAAEQFVPFTTTPGLPTGARSATANAGSGANWNIEIAIPWSLLGPLDAGVGRVVGFDLIIDDDDDPLVQTRKHYLIWQLNPTGSGCPEPYCSTSAFGDAVLTGAP